MAFGRASVFVFVFCALSALAPPAAMAAPSSVTVRLNDVDANSDEGAQIILRRIERAARAVCGRELALRYPSVRRAYLQCTQRTMSNTVDRIGAERLHSAFVTRFGHL
jgi:UrcA family protein